MTRWWRTRRLRLQLTLWYLLVMAAVIGVYAIVVFTFVRRNLENALDQQLQVDYQFALAAVAPQPDGSFACPLCDELEANELTVAFERGQGSLWLQVWSPEGDLLYASAEAGRLEMPSARAVAMRPPTQDGITASETPLGPVRVLSGHEQICPPGTAQPMFVNGVFTCPSALADGRALPPLLAVIMVALPSGPLQAQLSALQLVLLLGLPLGVVVAGVGGYTLARRALASVEKMAARARTITAESLHDRLPVENPDDEMGHLASVFNETLGRLEASFDQMRRFTADVSHELRTPLTAIQSVGEVGLREAHRDEAAYRRIIGSMLEEVDRLASLVGKLLELSRAETKAAEALTEVVDLPRLAEDVAAHLGVLAEEKQQTIAIEGGAALRCLGDRVVLRQALINLVHNAIKFSPVGGHVVVRLSRAEERAIIEVIDSGPGVPERMQSHLFDRFYGGEPPSGDTAAGAGLGLSIAKRAVEAHRGSLALAETGPGGTTFRISLPLLVPAAQRAG